MQRRAVADTGTYRVCATLITTVSRLQRTKSSNDHVQLGIKAKGKHAPSTGPSVATSVSNLTSNRELASMQMLNTVTNKRGQLHDEPMIGMKREARQGRAAVKKYM